MKRKSLLSRLLDHEMVTDLVFRNVAAGHLGHLRRFPGDLGKLGEPYIVGMALAMARIPPSPGWLPVVQAEAMRLGKVAESLQEGTLP